jgi:hypothetical protein
MKRLLKYVKEKKGISLVLIALFLAVLFMLAGLAIDITYMYYVKNQLQVAADAASLAGVAKLTGEIDNTSVNPNVLHQESARQEAWKFACKNGAAGADVFLITLDTSGTQGQPPDPSSLPSNYCDTTSASLTAEQLNGASSGSNKNNYDGDIVVGYWTLPPAPSGVTCETAGSGFFCPATGSTNLSINAIKVVARRTGEDPIDAVKIGHNAVRVFIGQVFRLIGINWSYMSARASAIASLLPPQIAPLPICLPSCALATPLDGVWGYDKNAPALVSIPDGFTASDNVRLCTDTDSAVGPFGQELYLSPSNDADRPSFAWTNFDLSDLTECDDKAKCNVNPKPGDITPYLPCVSGSTSPCGWPSPPICEKAICITNGSATGPVLNNALAPVVALHNSDSHEVGGTSINGWLVTLPVVLDCATGNQPCPGDPTGRPYPVPYLAKVIITDVISAPPHEDMKGIRLVGLNNATTITYTCAGKNPHDPNVTRTRLVTKIGPGGVCLSCNDPSFSVEAHPHLVK